jgi:hypothetical protein
MPCVYFLAVWWLIAVIEFLKKSIYITLFQSWRHFQFQLLHRRSQSQAVVHFAVLPPHT